MRGSSRLLKYRYLTNSAIVIAGYLAGLIQEVLYSLLVVSGLILLAVATTYYEYQERKVQPESKELRIVLEDEILPDVISDYKEAHPKNNPPEVRSNVMILRRRNINPLKSNRPGVRPWEKTLSIEASYGDYNERNEESLEWKTTEGVVGRAMNERAQEIWADLNHEEHERLLAGWNLTEAQLSRTSHLESLLSVPIYLPGDKEKIHPVGVLNVDSERPPEETRFDDENVRDNIIKHANIIGSIIE